MKRGVIAIVVFTLLLTGIVGCPPVNKNHLPTVSVTNPTNGDRVNKTVTFEVQGKDKDLPQGKKLTYSWDFGDGSKEKTQETRIDHTYAEPGRYVVKVVAIDDKGAESEEETVTIIVNEPPQASLHPSTKEGAAPLQVHFNATGSRDDAQIVKYEWDLDGDGRIDAEGLLASRTYEKPGTYHVKLIVTDNDGAKGEADVWIHVLAPQIAQICFDKELERYGSCGEGAPNPEIYVIPENHALSKVRTNIREILEVMAERSGPDRKLVILLEGEKAGKEVSSPINALPEELVQNILGVLFRKGGLSASEYLYLTDPTRFQLIGAEDLEAYNRHLNWVEREEDQELLSRRKTICRKGRQVIADYQREIAESVIQALLQPVCEGESDRFPDQLIVMNANAVLQLIYPQEASQLLKVLNGVSRGQASDVYKEAAARLQEAKDLLPSVWKITEELDELNSKKASQEKIREKLIELYKKISDLGEANTESFLYLMKYHSALKTRGIQVPRIEDPEKPALSLQKKSYDLLHKRDEAMAATVRRLRDDGDITEERPAVLIIGYFHLLGVTSELKTHGIPYQVITPFGLGEEHTPPEVEAMGCRRKGSAYVLCNLAPRSGTPRLRPPAVIDRPVFLEYEIPFLYQSILVDRLFREKLGEGKHLKNIKNEVRGEIQQITNAYNQALKAWSKEELRVRLEAEYDSIAIAEQDIYLFFKEEGERRIFTRLSKGSISANLERTSVAASFQVAANLWVQTLDLEPFGQQAQDKFEALLQGPPGGALFLTAERTDDPRPHLILAVKDRQGIVRLREFPPEVKWKLEQVDEADILEFERLHNRDVADLRKSLLEPLLDDLGFSYNPESRSSEGGTWEVYKIQAPEDSTVVFDVPEIPQLRSLIYKFISSTAEISYRSTYSNVQNVDQLLSMEVDGPITVIMGLPSEFHKDVEQGTNWGNIVNRLQLQAESIPTGFRLIDTTPWDEASKQVKREYEDKKELVQEIRKALEKDRHLLIFGHLAGKGTVEIGGHKFTADELRRLFAPYRDRRKGKITALLSCFGYIYGISDISVVLPGNVGFAPFVAFKPEHVEAFLAGMLQVYSEQGRKVKVGDWVKQMTKASITGGALLELLLLPLCIDLDEDEEGQMPCISSEEKQR